MSGKSRRHKGKHSFQSKKKKSSQRFSGAVAQEQVAAQVPEAGVPAEVSVPAARAPTPVAKSATVRYPYITAELKRIGILTGIILVILIVLAFTLS